MVSDYDQNGESLLDIENLKTYFYTPDGIVRAVDGVTLSLAPRETVGLVGESGCGKSVTAYSVLRLLPLKTSRIVEGSINFRRGRRDHRPGAGRSAQQPDSQRPRQ